jgi:Domain of unknown function (DUF1707)
MSGELVPDAKLLMGDADRERVVARLNSALAEGRLTLVEFEERISGVLAARTFGDVLPYLEGLPAAPVGPLPAVRTDVTLRGSSLRRGGRWVVPARQHIEAVGATVRLDFTEALISGQVVELDLVLRGSTVRMMVPVGSSLDAGGVSLVGGSVHARRLPEYPTGGGTHFVLTGEARGSTIWVRYPRQWSWPWERRRRAGNT